MTHDARNDTQRALYAVLTGPKLRTRSEERAAE
jgi:purine nucleoside phosphorylase